jgi:hypothetical protein
VGGRSPGAFIIVVRSKDAFTEIQRESSHVHTLPLSRRNGYTIC